MLSVVVTGVSSGIGLAAVKACTNHNIHVFGSVRRPEDAAKLTEEFGPSRFTPLVFDVRDAAGVKAAATLVHTQLQGKTLLGLVNNAGVADPTGFLELLPLHDLRHIFEVNLFGVHTVTRAFLPLLGLDGTLKGCPGRIVNISSIAGAIPMPAMGAYAASKLALEGYSHALRRELRGAGIEVIIMCPAEVESAIWGKARPPPVAAADESPGGPVSPRLAAMAEACGRWLRVEGAKNAVSKDVMGAAILKALTVRRPKAVYRASLMKFPQQVVLPLLACLPHRQLDCIISRAANSTQKPAVRKRQLHWPAMMHQQFTNVKSWGRSLSWGRGLRQNQTRVR